MRRHHHQQHPPGHDIGLPAAQNRADDITQEEVLRALRSVKGMQVVVQIIDIDHWMAKSRSHPEYVAHGTTINDAIINISRLIERDSLG